MLSQEAFRRAAKLRVERAGSQTRLAELVDLTQSQISDCLRGRFPANHMTLGTLRKLFPDAVVSLGSDVSEQDEVVSRL